MQNQGISWQKGVSIRHMPHGVKQEMKRAWHALLPHCGVTLKSLLLNGLSSYAVCWWCVLCWGNSVGSVRWGGSKKWHYPRLLWLFLTLPCCCNDKHNMLTAEGQYLQKSGTWWLRYLNYRRNVDTRKIPKTCI